MMTGDFVPSRSAKAICNHPECSRTLSRGNTSGLCVRHLHTRGLCLCGPCLQRGGTGMSPEQAREHATISAYLAGIPNRSPAYSTQRKWTS